jgi:hypothetical protein
VQFANGQRLAGAVFGPNPINVLREVADLVESVPDRKLKSAVGGAWGKLDLDFDQMLLGIGEGNGVGGAGRVLGNEWNCKDCDAKYEAADRRYGNFPELLRFVGSHFCAISRRRAGSFS